MSRPSKAPPAASAPHAASAEAPSFLVWQSDGATVDLAVIPNAKRTELAGLHDGALRVRLSAPPVDGAANEALQRWLADEVGVPKSRVQLLRGASGRRKRVQLQAERPQLQAWLARVTEVLARLAE
jgi:uncharacterized protein (TIGR00251 family)